MQLSARNGRIDPAEFYRTMATKVANSRLNGFIPKDGAAFGVTKGTPEEWARLFTMLQQQESGHRTAPVNPDGSLQRFSSTPAGERSYGPGQFNVGEYGLSTWNDVNDPGKVQDAYLNVAQRYALTSGHIRSGDHRGLDAYFGSIRRPHETTQHSAWFDKTVRPGAGSGSYAAMEPDDAAVASYQMGQMPGNSFADAAPVGSTTSAKQYPAVEESILSNAFARTALQPLQAYQLDGSFLDRAYGRRRYG